MLPRLKNWVKMSTTTTGTGTLTLGSAVSPYVTFATAGIADGDTVTFAVYEQTSNNPSGAWEVSTGVYTTSGTTLTRATLEASSTGSAISFAAGTKHVIIIASAGYMDRTRESPVADVAITGGVTLTAAAFGKVHRCSGTSADYTVVLPAVSGNDGKWIEFIMEEAADLSKLVTIDGASSETINGSTTRVMWAGESAKLLVSDGEWKKVTGRSIAMIAGLVASAAQTISTGTVTVLDLPTVMFDVGGMADASNDRIVIRRTGNYLLTVFGSMAIAAESGRYLTFIQHNSVNIVQTELQVNTPSDGHLSLVTNESLAATDTVRGAVYQGTGVNRDTYYITGPPLLACKLTVTEVPSW